MSKKRNKVDSHVQNSRTIIKNFRKSVEDGNTYALNLKTWNIDEKKGPSKIGIIYGYYNKDTEDFLSAKYETPVGNVIKILQGWEEEKTCGLLTNEQQIDIARFLTMLMVREPSMIDKTEAKTVIAKELGIKPTPSEFVHMLEKTNLVNIFFANHYPVCIFNEANKKFVSSIKGFCVWLSVNGSLNWWFPVTPTIAIQYVGEDVFHNLYNGSSCAVINEDKIVINYNNLMIESAIKEGNEYIFSSVDDELIRLKEKYNPNK